MTVALLSFIDRHRALDEQDPGTALGPRLLASIWRENGGDEAAAELLAGRWRQTTREAHTVAERIRAEATRAACCCRHAAEPDAAGCCERCRGVVA